MTFWLDGVEPQTSVATVAVVACRLSIYWRGAHVHGFLGFCLNARTDLLRHESCRMRQRSIGKVRFRNAHCERSPRLDYWGAVSAPDVGGLGLGFRGGSHDRRASRAGMWIDGDGRLHALLRDDGARSLWLPRHAAGGSTRRGTEYLAFSEAGSRSHFWAPVSTATRDNGHISLNARKSWITSASKATAYVWSSQPVQSGAGLSTLWLVPSHAAGIQVGGIVRRAGAARQRLVAGLG